MDTYRRKTLYLLIALLAIFSSVFVVSFIAIQKRFALIGPKTQSLMWNWVILVFSVLSVLRIIWEINEVEHPHEYGRRLRGRLGP